MCICFWVIGHSAEFMARSHLVSIFRLSDIQIENDLFVVSGISIYIYIYHIATSVERCREGHAIAH